MVKKNCGPKERIEDFSLLLRYKGLRKHLKLENREVLLLAKDHIQKQ